VRPLPRLFAFADDSVRRHPHLGGIAAAIASLGPPVALVARDPQASGAELTTFAAALLAHTRPVEASVFVSGRPDIAAGLGAHGLQLSASDLSPRDARGLMPHAWIGRSVHSAVEGATAVEEGADYLIAGNIFETRDHSGRPPAGLDLIETLASLGRPVIAFGGITPDTVWSVKHAGAYGVAATRALWHSNRPAQTALAMLEPWI
jgi:thiamine-phosphate diphosphorylase